jgi:hypothetical protein
MAGTFSALQRRQVRAAERRAADLVSRFYVLAPREWQRMPYEVRTLGELAPAEVRDGVFAQVFCYGVERRVGDRVVEERELYRICLQDDAILGRASSEGSVRVPALLLYVLTHELVHVVRFGQRMQAIDLPPHLRPWEEASVDRTARLILREADEPGLGEALERVPGPAGAPRV